jgi:hypothetical protein
MEKFLAVRLPTYYDAEDAHRGLSVWVVDKLYSDGDTCGRTLQISSGDASMFRFSTDWSCFARVSKKLIKDIL